jgi:CBS domain-containing protein
MHLFPSDHLLVVRNGDVVGVVGQRALLRPRGSARAPATVADVMSRAVDVVSPATRADEAERLMAERGLDALAVVYRGTVIGIVTNDAPETRAVRRPRAVRGH